MLNQEQQLIVDAVGQHPNIAVTACAGAGKSRVLIAAYAKQAHLAPTTAIVTYTQAAAAELCQRIKDQNLPEPAFVGTLHSLMLRLLRAEGHRVGFTKGIAVVDERTALGALRQSMKRVAWKGSLELAKKVISARTVETMSNQLRNDYHQKLGQDGLVSFDGILFWGSKVLDKVVGAVPFTNLMIDEYQDVSFNDHCLYDAMKVDHRFVVADPRQAIFGFRDGDYRCFESLMERKDWKVFQLSVNYRSTPEIVEVANALSDLLPVKDKMGAASKDKSTCFEVLECAAEFHQAAAIIDFIEDHEGGSVAILCRYNWQIGTISEYLRNHEIPHVVHGTAKKPPRWDAAQALVGFLSNPESEVMAYALAVATSSEVDADNMRRNAASQNVSFSEAVWSGDLPGISELEDVLDNFNLDAATQAPIIAIRNQLSFMDRSWASLAAAMADPTALTPKITDSKVPLICTVHASKGREFDSVILPYWSDELFPGNRQEGQDEEARLAYVAITRTRRNLTICSVAESPRYSGGPLEAMTPSRFIKAITNPKP